MKQLNLELKTGENLLFLDCVYSPQIRLVALAKPMCSFGKVLNQRVDWVAWASIQINGARDAIDDACTTSSGVVWRSLTPPSKLRKGVRYR